MCELPAAAVEKVTLCFLQQLLVRFQQQGLKGRRGSIVEPNVDRTAASSCL